MIRGIEVAMAIKVHKEVCNHCNQHFLIDSSCGGDYHPRVGLQWFCSDCGRMKPLIEVEIMLSNRRKRQISVDIARKYQLPFKECKTMALKIGGKNEKEFVLAFSTKLNSIFDLKITPKGLEKVL